MDMTEEVKVRERYEFHYDAGHGWLRVRVDELRALGIADKISGYSYRAGEWAYLEEDCDSEVFVKACGGLEKERYLAVNDGDSSWIRDLEPYR
ncbi:MAG: hypothetical protein KKB59_18875 [Spirochaetes bacterium]|nr:hypothetical protein [Spirochaetota bacterium]